MIDCVLGAPALRVAWAALSSQLTMMVTVVCPFASVAAATDPRPFGSAPADYTMPSIRFAEARAATAPTWMYQVTYAPAKVAAATHACDIVLWSGVLGPSGLVDFFYGENGIGDLERRLSQTMREDLVALARTGELPWDRYDRARRATRIYDIHPRIAFDPAAPERRIWDGAQL